MKRLHVLVLLLLFGLLISLGRAQDAEAGIFNADEEVTYKEYWISHKQFTAGCTDAGLPVSPNGSWYAEPDTLAKCPKSMNLNIVDNFSGALKAEVYVDLWRNYDKNSARLRINGLPTIYQSPRGYDWSRTPWVFEVPLNTLVQGTNVFQFWAENGKYHVHDVAVRIYYDDTHPLLVGGQPAVAPDGELISITTLDDTLNPVPAYTGGLLMVNNDQLTLKATADATAKYVEFHAFYDGYDDDNDGEWQDWHNVGRNNWWPGGQGEQELGGTINNIATIKAKAGGGEVSAVWNIKHIVNQTGVKFKIRIVDAAGNVREGAGGVTPDYTLARNYPVVYYTMPNFDDYGLHMGGDRPDLVSYNFPLPADLDLSEYAEGYLIGMYWKRPYFSLNGSNAATVRGQGGDEWSLGVRLLNKSLLKAGNNQLDYVYSGSGEGHFIERPGPMIVLRGNYAAAPDLSAPYIISRSPAPLSTNVDVFAPISLRLGDVGGGIDKNSIIMTVAGQLVEPTLTGASNNLTVTFTPTVPYPALTTIPVTFYACDIFSNCMPLADEFSFTTEPPDLTAPVISNVHVDSSNTSATVTWTTDEGATSKVEYGATTGYEKPSVSDNTLVTQHSLFLDGLSPHSTYHFRLTSTDFSNNTAVTTDLTFQTKIDPGNLISDDFSDCVLDTSVWSYINPKSDSVLTLTGAGAQISVPTGSGHDLWKQGMQAPRLMQFVTDQDFDIEVKFDATVNKKTQSMGILVQQDTAEWLRFNFQNDGTGLNSIVAVDSHKNNPQVVFSTPVTIGATSNYMRLNRAGDLWNLQYSTDGTNWIFATTITRTLAMSQIGPYIGNTSTNPAFVGTIDYFENMNAQFTDQDPPIGLNVLKDGVGTVTLSPDKPSYNCNETVTLTAAPAADWTFIGWSGAIDSTNPIETITLTKTETVTAEFSNNNFYTLGVNVVNQGNGVGGTISKDPDQGTYAYGTPVELTAVAEPGWSFVGWSGDWVDTAPMTTVPITGNMTIDATFDEDEYTLETLIIADGVGQGGTITVDPLQPTYLYGDPVTLTVTIDPGWSFVGWEGEGVSGTNPVLPITMTQNVVAIAHLVQNQYDVNVIVDNVGETPAENGVLKDPDQPTYGYGQEITLTASADLGWLFTGWSGDLSGATPSQSLVITDDKDITATFTQQHYTIAVTVPGGHGSVQVSPEKPYYLYGDVVTLTPVADQGYEFVLWSGDLTGTTKPAFFAVEQNYNIEATFAVDSTPIEILSHSIEVLPGGTLARVSWTTDVPGTSIVDFGETTFYEGGTVSETDLVTEHEIVLTGLSPETFYHYQITSADQYGNEAQSEDLVFSTSSSSGIFSDDFSSCELDDKWTWVDPLGDGTHVTEGGQVKIGVPAGTTHNVFTTGIDAPRLMQPSNDTDFTIEVKFDSNLANPIAMQGLIIEEDAQNFIRFDFYKRNINVEEDPNDDDINVYAVTFEDLSQKVRANKRVPEVPGSMYMRVTREGNDWTQWYSFDGENWTENASFTLEMVVKRVGVFAGNTPYKGNIPAHTAVVDYFFNTAAPIEPEDSHYQLDFEIDGSGAVQANPDKEGYYCGEEVTLTAVGSPGWGFVGWSGDLTGTNPTRKITVTDDMNIVARFQLGAASYSLALPMVIRP